MPRRLPDDLALPYIIFLDYVRSWNIWLELGVAVLVGNLPFLPFVPGRVSERDFLLAETLFVIVLSIYTTANLVRRGTGPGAYLLLARRPGRVGYTLALLCSALVIVFVAAFIAIVVFGLAHAQALAPSFRAGGLLRALVSAMLGALLAASGALLFMPLVTDLRWRLLGVVVVALIFYARLGLPTDNAIDPFTSKFHIFLEPVFSLLRLATTGQAIPPLGTVTTFALILIYAAIMVWLATWSVEQRDLWLD